MQKRVGVHDETRQRQGLDGEALAGPAHGQGADLSFFDAVLVEVLAVPDVRVQFAVAEVTTIRKGSAS